MAPHPGFEPRFTAIVIAALTSELVKDASEATIRAEWFYSKVDLFWMPLPNFPGLRETWFESFPEPRRWFEPLFTGSR